MHTSRVIAGAGQHGQAGGLGLHQGHGQTLVQGREQKAVHSLQKLGNILPRAEKTHIALETEGRRFCGAFRALQRAGAGQQKDGCRLPGGDGGKNIQQLFVVLLRVNRPTWPNTGAWGARPSSAGQPRAAGFGAKRAGSTPLGRIWASGALGPNIQPAAAQAKRWVALGSTMRP